MEAGSIKKKTGYVQDKKKLAHPPRYISSPV
jgi:hypothetical protein